MENKVCRLPQTFSEELLAYRTPCLDARMKKVNWHVCANSEKHKCEMRCSEHCRNAVRGK